MNYMINIKVSIIIPIYNVASYVEQCLLSVAVQTYHGDMECLLVDDCGKDESMNICERIIDEYRGNIDFQIIHHERNQGLSAARNTGIRAAKGDYLLFLDSDDKLFPNSISALLSLVEKYPDVDMVQGNIEVEPHDAWQYDLLHFSEKSLAEYWNDRTALQKLVLSKKLPMTAWNKLVRRDFIVNNNLFFLEGYIHEDEMWRWDYQKHIRTLAICYENTIWYRIDNQTSIMSNVDKTRSTISNLEIFKRMANFVETEYEKQYVLRYACLDNRFFRWNFIKDRNSVMIKAREVYLSLKKNRVKHSDICMLAFFWALPFGLINNRFFGKFYLEWRKKYYNFSEIS